MCENNNQDKTGHDNDFHEDDIYRYCGETDDEIILQIKKRKDENTALKKLLENLNSRISESKSKKDV
jgi:hypothetical protein